MVEVAEVMVPLKAVKVCKVVEPSAKRSEVVVAPPKMVRPVPTVLPPMVVEALETSPPLKRMPVEVALKPSPCLVNGYWKVMEAQPVQLVTDKFPMLATFALN